MKVKCTVLCMAVSLLLAESAVGEAGFSEILNSRSLWIEKPYALIWGGDHDIGIFTVDLVRAESARPWRGFDKWCFSYDGLNPTEWLVHDIAEFARERSLFLMRLRPYEGREAAYAVLNLDDGSVTDLSSEAHFRQFLGEQGLSLDRLRFDTFDGQYKRQQTFTRVWTAAIVLALSALVAILVIKIRRRRTSQQPPLNDSPETAPET